MGSQTIRSQSRGESTRHSDILPGLMMETSPIRKHLVKTILSLKESFEFDPDVIFMGDSALYTEKNINSLGK